MRVHNITDRAAVPRETKAYKVGQHVVRPGKYIDVEGSTLTRRDRALHGGALWIGELPRSLVKASQAALAAKAKIAARVPVPAMPRDQVLTYLQGLSTRDLVDLCSAVIPPLVFDKLPPRTAIATRLSRVLFANRTLDPEVFYWLGRWDRVGGVYVERNSEG